MPEPGSMWLMLLGHLPKLSS
ncbi:hypothetical protein [Hymenobacter wooponensis]